MKPDEQERAREAGLEMLEAAIIRMERASYLLGLLDARVASRLNLLIAKAELIRVEQGG